MRHNINTCTKLIRETEQRNKIANTHLRILLLDQGHAKFGNTIDGSLSMRGELLWDDGGIYNSDIGRSVDLKVRVNNTTVLTGE